MESITNVDEEERKISLRNQCIQKNESIKEEEQYVQKYSFSHHRFFRFTYQLAKKMLRTKNIKIPTLIRRNAYLFFSR